MQGVASSLPVSMAPSMQQKVNGVKSLGKKANYSTKTNPNSASLAVVKEEDERRGSRSAVANRRESYAERDRARLLDPGILDFVPDEDDDDIAHMHFHFSPPLLRSASVRKFLVG